jgi:hypothetical protein
MRMALALTAVYLLTRGVAATVAAESSSPTSRPGALAGDTELRLSIMEIRATIEDLKRLKPGDLEKVTTQRKSKVMSSDVEHAVPVSDLRTYIDYGSKARFHVGVSMPVVMNPASPDSKSRNVAITYQDVGTDVQIQSDSGGPADGIRLQLKCSVSIPSLPSRGPRKKDVYEKTVDVAPGKPANVLLDDAPVELDDKGNGRLCFARLSLEPRRKQGAFASKAAVQVSQKSASANTRAAFDCIQLTATVEKLSSLDLNSMCADAPSATDLLKRLGTLGDAFDSSASSFSFDAADGTSISCGASVPSVTDVNIGRGGRVTPSVTYKDIGNILSIGGMTWSGHGRDAKASTRLEIHNSGLAQSSVIVSSGVKLPAFSQFRIEHSQEFRSGVPEYLIIRGPAGPGTTETTATLLIVRLVLTAP